MEPKKSKRNESRWFGRFVVEDSENDLFREDMSFKEADGRSSGTMVMFLMATSLEAPMVGLAEGERAGEEGLVGTDAEVPLPLVLSGTGALLLAEGGGAAGAEADEVSCEVVVLVGAGVAMRVR